ncbi:MAG TPA: hypothetical protein VE956_04540 [Nodularia sp. (in: cyanobacteria)]|nr:hypothetical protein [Nodularia sp. (in: cyanobacteria)]
MKLNLSHGVLVVRLALLGLMPLAANAQTNSFQYPQPNRQGDYTSILSKFQDGKKSDHLVWKVVASKLNCRAQAGVNYRVVRSLAKGDNLNIAGNPTIYRDKQGKPWLYVAKEGSAEDIKIRCFVRANNQFIKPIPYSF